MTIQDLEKEGIFTDVELEQETFMVKPAQEPEPLYNVTICDCDVCRDIKSRIASR